MHWIKYHTGKEVIVAKLPYFGLLFVLLLTGCVGSHKPTAWHSTVVKRGDNLYAFSKRYQISLASLAKANHLKKPYLLKAGSVDIGAQRFRLVLHASLDSPDYAAITERSAAFDQLIQTLLLEKASKPHRQNTRKISNQNVTISQVLENAC